MVLAHLMVGVIVGLACALSVLTVGAAPHVTVGSYMIGGTLGVLCSAVWLLLMEPLRRHGVWFFK